MRLHRHEHKPRVEMLALMDVVFLLLVFFIYAMMTMTLHRGMPLKLPFSGEAQLEKSSVLALSVTANGAIFLNKEEVLLEELTARLKQEYADESETVALQIFVADTLAYQELYRVLDAVRAAGIQKISLQAQALP